MGLFDFMKPKSEFEIMLEQAKKDANLNHNDALYQFEHKYLPALFYKGGEEFFNNLIGNREYVCSLYRDECNNMRQTAKYEAKDFQLTAHYSEKNMLILKLHLPEPYRSPLCFDIYMVIDENRKPYAYYTFEKGLSGNPNVMCSWGSNGNHYNYGSKTIEDLCGEILCELPLSNGDTLDNLIGNQNNLGITKDDEMITVVNDFPKDSLRKTCRNCGAELDEDAKFCHKCGAKIG